MSGAVLPSREALLTPLAFPSCAGGIFMPYRHTTRREIVACRATCAAVSGIHATRQREKTDEQRAREYRELKRIEAAKAEKRMKAGKKDPPLNLGEGAATGEASKIAAAEVGWSHMTADKAEAVPPMQRI